MPEYFLVPLATAPRSLSDRCSRRPRASAPTPSSYGATGRTTTTRPTPSIRAPAVLARRPVPSRGSSGSRSSRLRPPCCFSPRASPGALVRFGMLSADGSTRWGSTVSVAAGATRVDGRAARGSASRVCPSRSVGIAAAASGGHHGGRATLRARRVARRPRVVPGPWRLAGFSQGYVVFTFAKPPTPITASTAAGVPLPSRCSRAPRSPRRSGSTRRRPATVIRSVAWDSGWQADISVNGGPPEAVPVHSFDLVQQVRIPPGRRPRDLPLPAAPPHCWRASSASVRSGLLARAARRLVRRRRRRRHGPDTSAAAPHREMTPRAVEPVGLEDVAPWCANGRARQPRGRALSSTGGPA